MAMGCYEMRASGGAHLMCVNGKSGCAVLFFACFAQHCVRDVF